MSDPVPPQNLILGSVKKVLGIGPDDDVFDIDIILHVNTALSMLNLIGVGPAGAYAIDDGSELWTDLLGTDKNYLNLAKSYVIKQVQMLWDPPSTSFALEATQAVINKMEWLLSLYAAPANYTTSPPTGIQTTP